MLDDCAEESKNIFVWMYSGFFLPLQYLDFIRQTTHDNLKNLIAAPSEQMHDVPPDLLSLENTDETDPDIRISEEDMDKRYELSSCLTIFYSTIKLFDLKC